MKQKIHDFAKYFIYAYLEGWGSNKQILNFNFYLSFDYYKIENQRR